MTTYADRVALVHLSTNALLIRFMSCTRCGAKQGEPCRTPKGLRYYTVHGERMGKRVRRKRQ